eukprot:TRINITY_DN619_c0_g1_i1.p1 TRINITY_DN619_c0_g1~~TRINITY_DN619_c0_g1_i1.p1  ORF type:complete len:122 (-),score=9.45 TRINITY_DN619_c0_g1_i1:459-824(-)
MYISGLCHVPVDRTAPSYSSRQSLPYISQGKKSCDKGKKPYDHLMICASSSISLGFLNRRPKFCFYHGDIGLFLDHLIAVYLFQLIFSGVLLIFVILFDYWSKLKEWQVEDGLLMFIEWLW